MNFALILHLPSHLSTVVHAPGASGAGSLLAMTVLVCAAIPAVLFAGNLILFRRPGPPWNRRVLPPVSVLIPARNEAGSILAAVDAVLASRGVDLDLIVLDDGSTDETAALVRQRAKTDFRLRLETAPPLPEGWNGKQHACWVLASLARRDVFCFLDADVRLGPEALYRMLSELNCARETEDELALVSGFPRQQTVTPLEWLLLPLMHFILLGFLPLAGERWSRWTSFAAGCGQFMMVRRKPYFSTGGHGSIRTTMHDGLMLPKLLRSKGFRTRIFDLSKDAVCRMYRGAGEVWQGLAKNATEGMATPRRIPVFSALLLLGQVLPLPLVLWANLEQDEAVLQMAWTAALLGFAMRALCALRYRQSWWGVPLHPIGVMLLLVLQWQALARKLSGRPATWKERAYQAG